MSLQTYKLLIDLQNKASESVLNHGVAAIICTGNKILDKPYCNTPDNKNGSSIHAEINVIIHNIDKIQNTKRTKNKIDIIVGRFTKELLSNARPCNNCLNYMKHVGIRRVYYTTPEGLICENIKNMLSIKICSPNLNKNYKKYNNNNNLLYNKLLEQQFNQPIYSYNLNLFIKYNLIKILPKYYYIITKKSIQIYDSNNILIIDSKIDI
uniref:CMP/dCMP-type deaminase domain-containing protein n=1 Tax=viral metagenome TaxID=1070528 RepID=A0A6C0H844_9ZZZZ